MEINDSTKARSHCLKLLARREHSQLELQEKLCVKGFEQSICEDVIEGLAQQNLQSDCRFAEHYARQRMLKGFGPLSISMSLTQKGISDFSLDDLVDEEFGGWAKVLQKIYDKKYRAEPWGNGEEKLKRMRFLQTKGFPSELIQRFITSNGSN